MDAVEFYHHSGVVSEYKSGFGTVWWFGIGWCLLKIEKLVVFSTLSVVVSEMFKTREAMPALTQALQGKVRQVLSTE